MRISDLISMGQRYLVVGFVAAAIVLIIIFLIYKKLQSEGKKIPVGKLMFVGVFICYMVVVLGVTLLDRGDFWQNGKTLPLLYSYRDAWVNFSVTAWRNIILNICMFVPFGILLPLGIPFFRKFWKTYLAGFVFTVCIEGVQLILNRGIFELDDIMHNTIGAMIGYGIYALMHAVILKKKQEDSRSLKWILLLQIPVVITVAVFAGIFISYERQELGNIGNQCLVPYDRDKLQVTSDIEFDKEQRTQPVYKCRVFTKDEAKEFAVTFFQNLGDDIDEERNDFYEDTAVFWSKGHYNLWVDYRGGTYRFTDFETSFSEEPLAVKTDAEEEELREVLESYGVEVPENAVMEYNPETEGYVFEVTKNEADTFTDGRISCRYYENGKLADIDYSVMNGDYYKEFKVISEQEAYDMICEGEFDYRSDIELEIRVSDCNLKYQMDSKGFYQPVYEFVCEINGQPNGIIIAAIQDKK